MKKIAGYCHKIFWEVLIGLTLCVFVLGGFLAWKLSDGAMNLDRAIPYIQSQFDKSSSDQTIEIGSLDLEWQGFENPLGLSAKEVVISNQNGPFIYAPEIDLNISLRSLLMGRLHFETVWIRQIALSITKTTDGQVQITGQKEVYGPQRPTDQTAAILTLNDLLYDLTNLDVLWIDKARIIYNDRVAKTIQQFNPVTFYIERTETVNTANLFGFLTFPFGENTDDNVVKLNFSTQNNPVLMTVTGVFKDTPIDSYAQFLPPLPDGVDLNMVASAEINLQLNNSWNIHKLDVKLNAPKGQIHFPLNDKDDFVEVEDFKLYATQDPKTDTIIIDELSALVNETVNISVSGSLSQYQNIDALSGNLNLAIKNLPQSYFPRFWPESVQDNGAYRWLGEKMQGGNFASLNITSIFDLAKKTRTDESPLPPQIISVKGDMAYSGLNIDYNNPMASAKNVSGTGAYEGVSLTLNVAEADIGGMKTTDATLFFDDLITKGAGVGKLQFPVTGPTQAVFDYIAAEPIAAFKNIDFKGQNTKGDVKATIDIEIPLVKGTPIEDVKIEVNGTVTNADIPNAVKGLSLSGGPYDIFATTRQIKVKGEGELSGQPITLDWHEYFSKDSAQDYLSKITAQVTANDTIRRAFTGDFSRYFSGNTTGEIDYMTAANGRDTTIDIKLDLTNTAVKVNSIGIDKARGVRGSGSLKVKLKNGDLSSIENLKINGRGLSLQSGTLDFRNVNGEPYITKADLKNVAFNENRINVAMAEQDNILKTNVTGDFLDIRPIMQGEKDDIAGETETPGRAKEYGIDVAQMRGSNDYTLKQAKAYVRLNKNGTPDQFELDAKLGDAGQYGDLFIRYTPEVADGLSLRVESNNAGETLRAFDLYPYIKGGELQIAGTPIAGGRFGDVRGKARINDFSVANAPVLLRLINALSFQNFLRAGQLSFARLESDFEWKLGADGDIYTIRNGTTSGASVALTFDGFIDTTTDNLEITGTAAPLSELNSFIGKIPLLGQILTGGDALLAATYSIKGNPSDPSVAVNPLSILTPGIIRKMLFENTPKAENQKEETPTPNQQGDERTRGLN